MTDAAPQVGQCVLSVGTTPITRNVLVEFTTPSIVLNSGGDNATLNQLRMEPVGGTAPKAQYVFSPTDVSNKITLNVGGRLNFTSNQAIGNYTGTISITANLQ